jgi:molybdopterin/thiamine biosynthesis adenylyltransferase
VRPPRPLKPINTAHANPAAVPEDRYSRQILLPEIGEEGHRRLRASRVVIIGCGALGTNVLSLLVRAGIGDITVVDRDVVELTNLQRQTVFDEDDVGRPKAEAAVEHMRRVNSEVEIRGVVSEVNEDSVDSLVDGADLVLDATDNMATRFTVNDSCVRLSIPWIYAGAVGTSGMVFVVHPDGPCLRCLFASEPAPGSLPTCSDVGIVNSLPSVVASIEVTEAYKILMRSDPVRDLIVLDLWQEDLQKIRVERRPDCRCCGGPPRNDDGG